MRNALARSASSSRNSKGDLRLAIVDELRENNLKAPILGIIAK